MSFYNSPKKERGKDRDNMKFGETSIFWKCRTEQAVWCQVGLYTNLEASIQRIELNIP